MNVWQALRHIKAVLKAATWAESPNEAIFGTVVVSAVIPRSNLSRLRMPSIMIAPDVATTDPSTVTIEDSDIRIQIMVRSDADNFGEAGLIGLTRGPGGEGSSQGRGLMELEAQLFALIALQQKNNGVQLILRGRSKATPVDLGDENFVYVREYVFGLWATTQPSYPAPTRLNVTDQGSGNALLVWRNPFERFDLLGLVVRRASGSTPPATVTDGVDVPVSGIVETVADSPGSGEWSYSLFSAYDESSDTPTTADKFSDPVSFTVTLA